MSNLLEMLSSQVALREEGVDRNTTSKALAAGTLVALREEGVDRNCVSSLPLCWSKVALREEGVDRNLGVQRLREGRHGRPPRGGRG